ncbi:aryl hydrocarbon receptor nuclear translocator-like protein 1 [Zerene cesonia]|uniref:aryl hydrocarbon receptor nuclear translocator-like protein 1 n=1 Tax=Zerene cesonia TaxID=33412 RepID=UPI0018E54148|nr:aryl hydrocarbon receptor nuclear translocator-like protein 1 [Zerene cesonia]
MSDWSVFDREYADRYDSYPYPYYEDKLQQVPAECAPSQTQDPYAPPPTLTLLLSPQIAKQPCQYEQLVPKGDSPREMRNKAEKQRRDKMNESIAHLATIVPPVAIPARKIDKISKLRLTAHYLRSHQYVFGDTIDTKTKCNRFSVEFTKTLLRTLKGFLIALTYKGLVVVVSPNIQEYLGYSELELLGQSIYSYVHEHDHALLREQLMPQNTMLGSNGELLIPEDPEGKKRIAEELRNERRSFIIRFKKLNQQRSGPVHYVTCHVEGTLRMADKACPKYNRVCQIVRRARFRGENPTSSGNDVVFIGMARPTTETFMTEGVLESFKLEYRTRHSIDGEIIQCEQRIALVTGYMTHEVSGMNAMNFMHRDDVRWVIFALREMYVQNRIFGESCYRLMTKNGRFIYMRTRGRLDVDKNTNAVTSFVCTNTVVNEDEGKQLIRLMKKRFKILVNNGDDKDTDEDEASQEVNEKNISVEDPEQLQEVILHLVTNLPSQDDLDSDVTSPSSSDNTTPRLSIIPPKKDRIVKAILKSTFVIGNQPSYGKSYRRDKLRPFRSVSQTPPEDPAEPQPGPSGICGVRRSHEDTEEEPPSKILKNEDIYSEDSLLEALRLDADEQIKISEIDANGIDYKNVLEEAKRDKSSYFEDFL